MCGIKLSVVQEESSFGRGFLLEGYGRILCLAGGSDLKVSDLATAEKWLNSWIHDGHQLWLTRKRRNL
jgi:hypothetical protein